jgi:hypothetical protein
MILGATPLGLSTKGAAQERYQHFGRAKPFRTSGGEAAFASHFNEIRFRKFNAHVNVPSLQVLGNLSGGVADFFQ